VSTLSLRHLAARLVLATPLLLAATAFAETSEDCSGFLPDFRCERDARYEGFIPPTSMPYLFEDPFITTEISAHVIWHDFPWDSAFRGGEVWVAAVQVRLALTERLAFIATKDGYAWFRPGSHSQLDDEEGFFDIGAGFKYALIDRPEDRFILTPSVRLDLPTGQKDAFSGNGDGVFIPAISSGLGTGPLHWIGSFGARIPFDTGTESTSLFYNLHVDTSLTSWLSPFLELNGTTWVKSGDGTLDVHTRDFGTVDLTTAQDVLHGAGVTRNLRWEGADVVNLGSRGVAGHTVATLAAGARFLVTKHVSFGAYYEFPITKREDIFEQRVAVNATYTF
jgi:hypothetical protein